MEAKKGKRAAMGMLAALCSTAQIRLMSCVFAAKPSYLSRAGQAGGLTIFEIATAFGLAMTILRCASRRRCEQRRGIYSSRDNGSVERWPLR
ncbi:MAG: hypothetical protein PHQ35_01850 [Phycisphaerae bacterium]|nr:hypothetical protein [Phycisphaerae bacterium]MDD5380388.1 hypothetical protein [Phycisphaerae bacterium]